MTSTTQAQKEEVEKRSSLEYAEQAIPRSGHGIQLAYAWPRVKMNWAMRILLQGFPARGSTAPCRASRHIWKNISLCGEGPGTTLHQLPCWDTLPGLSFGGLSQREPLKNTYSFLLEQCTLPSASGSWRNRNLLQNVRKY